MPQGCKFPRMPMTCLLMEKMRERSQFIDRVLCLRIQQKLARLELEIVCIGDCNRSQSLGKELSTKSPR